MGCAGAQAPAAGLYHGSIGPSGAVWVSTDEPERLPDVPIPGENHNATLRYSAPGAQSACPAGTWGSNRLLGSANFLKQSLVKPGPRHYDEPTVETRPTLLLCLGPLALGLCCASPLPRVDSPPGSVRLAEKYHSLRGTLFDNGFRLPIHLEADQTGGRLQGDVYGVVDHSFERVRDALRAAADWCEVVPLHLNIKACTHEIRDGRDRVSFYAGRKFYESPESAHRMNWSFYVRHAGSEYFEVALAAAEGPLDTRDYVLELSAIPLDDERTFLHLRYAHQSGLASRIAMGGYLATLGRHKVGFSVVGSNAEGRPVYVDGKRGVIERNAVRYHLAVQAYLDTLGVPEEDRFEQRINRWFDLTDLHPEQLRELERDAYLAFKRRERADQLRLQRALDEPTRPESVASLAPSG